ncbi:MAG TPA: hypothetical protein VGF29_18980 [Hyphomicrobiaceae bacterium]
MAVAPDPLGATCVPAARTPTLRSAAVATFSRRGFIQLGLRVANHARIPVAAAPVVIAVAMHCMHMAQM